MKKTYLLLALPIVLYSCNQTQKAEQKDTMPITELELIKVFGDADSAYNAQINEINKKDIFDRSKVKISQFMSENLTTKTENWQAVIHAIEVDGLNGGVNVTFRIAKGLKFDEKYPEFHSIILKSHILDSDNVKNMLKALQSGDKVLITGNFLTEKDSDGNVKFDAFAIGSTENEEVLTNPAFDFTLINIKKLKTR